jgi:hypothetical protein
LKKYKYKNCPVEIRGQKFRSKLEARFASTLDWAKLAGEVDFYLRETRFDLPGGIFYYLDFMIFYSDGTIRFVECKGKDTRTSINKRKTVMDMYNIEIEVHRA